jgi:cyclophilin family peptidyl-prolyl cis-trans isomerase
VAAVVSAGGQTDGARARAPVAALLSALAVGACASANQALYAPTAATLDARAPDSFVVAMETSEGTLEIVMRRDWSPLAVDRAYHLMSNDFYAGARFYRVVPGFVVQWGFSGDPVLDSTWRREGLEDEPVVGSNVRGTVSFARAGPRTRSYTMFINLAANERLDSASQGGVVGYPPIGEIRSRLDVIDGFYSAYDLPGSVQDSIRMLGNDWVRRAYPQMDSIVGTRVVAEWR